MTVDDVEYLWWAAYYVRRNPEKQLQYGVSTETDFAAALKTPAGRVWRRQQLDHQLKVLHEAVASYKEGESTYFSDYYRSRLLSVQAELQQWIEEGKIHGLI
jgi:hypothetical protein